jgi:hypothetical protein
MDKESVKKRWLGILTRLFREEDMDDDEFEEIVDEVMMIYGGWEKFYSDVQVGISNGFTEEQQFVLFEKLLVRGNPVWN